MKIASNSRFRVSSEAKRGEESHQSCWEVAALHLGAIDTQRRETSFRPPQGPTAQRAALARHKRLLQAAAMEMVATGLTGGL